MVLVCRCEVLTALNVEIVVLALECLFNLFYILFILCSHKKLDAVAVDKQVAMDFSLIKKCS